MPVSKAKTSSAKRVGGRPSPREGVFESREKEPNAFDVMGIRPTRDFSTGRLVWTVPADKVELFCQHFHVMNNRIVYRGRKDSDPQLPNEAETKTPTDQADQEDEASDQS